MFENIVHSTSDIDPLLTFVAVKGYFSAECLKADGTTRWKIDRLNGVTVEGFNIMLDSTFRNGTATLYPNWYIGLIGTASYTSGLNSADVMSNHPGWAEDSTHYTPAVGGQRPQWSPGAAASKQLSNASSVNFTINTDGTVIKGIFVCSDITLGGTSGKLWATGLFGSDQTLYNTDILKITYTVALS